jgi:hypothetical protein
MSKKIDVILSVCGKPFQTALALLTLERECGHHIDKIYFIEENTKSQDIDTGCHGWVLNELKDKIVHYVPKQWNYCFPLETEKLDDEDYRHSVRYQYGWEMTDKDHALIIHNDVYFHGDVVGAMLDNMGDNICIGHVGQCWYCPAAFAGKCDSNKHMEYRPDFDELNKLYKTTTPPEGYQIRAYYMPTWNPRFMKQPWPLPECRVNEWCALIDMKKARKLTVPHGRVTPFGAILGVGKQIQDVSCEWFREMHMRGHLCENFDIYKYMHHDVPPTGQVTLITKDKYKDKELEALEKLQTEFDYQLER